MISPAGDPDAAGRCLHEVWQELTRRGFAMDQPRATTCMCFIHGLRRAQCAMDLLAGGALVWEFIPLGGTVIPGRVAAMAAVLLGGQPASVPRGLLRRYLPGQPPAGPAGVTVREVAGQVLARRGLAEAQAETGGAGDAWPVTVAASVAQPARGHVCIGDEGDLRWECSFAYPGGPARGLAPATIAQIIAAALAGQRDADHDAAACSLPSWEDLAPWTETAQTTTWF
jgi:hypothetical protein